MTPVQICRNVTALAYETKDGEFSSQFRKMGILMLERDWLKHKSGVRAKSN